MNDQLQEALNQLPHKPGVYQYYDREGRLLYVGKAKDLSKRVHSYWQNKAHSPWTRMLVQEIVSLKTVEVKSEIEALLLENSLVKSLKPKYNIQLKDDKTFPYLRISHEPFPVFTITRQIKHDKARYLGPYLSANYLRSMLKILQELYGIKTVKDASYEARSDVPKEIGLGARYLDNQAEHIKQVEAAIQFLGSPQPKMEKAIKQAMQQAAENQQFERAAILRDRWLSLQSLRNTQTLFSPTLANRDYIGLTVVGPLAAVYILHEREGKMADHHSFLFETRQTMPYEELMAEVIPYLYTNGLPLPKELVLSHHPTDEAPLLALLCQQADRKIKFIIPQRGELKARLETATENAKSQLYMESLKHQRRDSSLQALKEMLNLSKLPRRIEAFDISNLGATNIVGASIVFIDGKPAKNEYRKYKINTPDGQDDFASMRELVYRRVSNKTRPLPDLLLIDGGKGQLSAALDALQLAKKELPIISLAKKEELIFLPHNEQPIVLPQDSPALLLLTAIRDEVHRFVITFHRQRRSKSLLPK